MLGIKGEIIQRISNDIKKCHNDVSDLKNKYCLEYCKKIEFLFIRNYFVLKELTTNPSTQNGRKETENLYAFGL